MSTTLAELVIAFRRAEQDVILCRKALDAANYNRELAKNALRKATDDEIEARIKAMEEST